MSRNATRPARAPLTSDGRRMFRRDALVAIVSVAAYVVACIAAGSLIAFLVNTNYAAVSRVLAPEVRVAAPSWLDVEGLPVAADEPVEDAPSATDVSPSAARDEALWHEEINQTAHDSLVAVKADGVRAYLTDCVEGRMEPVSAEASAMAAEIRALMDGSSLSAEDAAWTATSDLQGDAERVERLFPEAQEATGFDFSEYQINGWVDEGVFYALYGDGTVTRQDQRLLDAVLAVGPAVLLVLAAGGLCAVIAWGVYRPLARYDALSAAVAQLAHDPGARPELPAPLEDDRRALWDIAERNDADVRAATSAERRKNELVAYLAHDIKTPLTAIAGYLTLLDEASDMPDEQRERYIACALAKTYRLDAMIDEFFDITRYNLGRLAVERARIDLALFCEQLADEFLPQLEARGLELAVSAPDDVVVFVDGGKLFRALSNVMKNAVAFADEGTTIELVAQVEPSGGAAEPSADGAKAVAGAPHALPDGEGLAVPEQGTPASGTVRPAAAGLGAPFSIAIRDQGREIAPEHLERIFDQFYREDDARSSERGGAGLGLAIAREIVRAHGGTIEARSERGVTTFTIHIPAA